MLILRDLLSRFSQLKSANCREQLRVEIAIIVVIKIVLLWLIWWLCFSHPVSKETRQQAVTQILLTPSK